MILTDREIKIAIERGLIVVDPRPKNDAFSSTSLDLTLDPHLSEYGPLVPGVEKALDPAHPEFDGGAVIEDCTSPMVIPKTGYLLYPNTLVLAWTAEYVDLKLESHLAARIEGKSSLARLGLGVHVNAPTIHAGFDGHIRLEMVNHGRLPIRLRSGMKLCQLIFELTYGTPEKGYKGQYSGQSVTDTI